MRMRPSRLVLFAVSGLPLQSYCTHSAVSNSDIIVADANIGAMERFVTRKIGVVDTREFLVAGPFPGPEPWKAPVRAEGLGLWSPPNDPVLELKTGVDGFLRERYESRPCPDQYIWECVEVWATGFFGGNLSCFGARVQYTNGRIGKAKLPLRAAGMCPIFRGTSQEESATRRREQEERLTRKRMNEQFRALPL
jgi:hypothetical protein